MILHRRHLVNRYRLGFMIEIHPRKCLSQPFSLGFSLFVRFGLRFRPREPIQHPQPCKRYKVVGSVKRVAPETEETVKHLCF